MPVARTTSDPRKKALNLNSNPTITGRPSCMSDISSYVETLRQAELPSLYLSGQPTLYLDSAGSPPVPRSLLQEQCKEMEKNLFGNPHSANPSARLAANRIEEVRKRVCKEIFGVNRFPEPNRDRRNGNGKQRADQDEEEDLGWEIIFTSGATASLKLAAECFNFSSGSKQRANGSDAVSEEDSPDSSTSFKPSSCSLPPQSQQSASSSSSVSGESGSYIHTIEAHTSLVALREVVTSSTPSKRHMAASSCFAMSEEEILKHVEDSSSAKDMGPNLIALPLQCNATGFRSRRFLDKLMDSRKKGSLSRFHILLDASSYLSSASNFDLSSCQYSGAPEMIAFSFPKIFGLPTGLGGLLVKRSLHCKGLLDRKSYFGGGTLDAQVLEEVNGGLEVWKQPSEELSKRMEDGSPNTQSIIAISSALSVFDRLFGDWKLRKSYVKELTRRLFCKMSMIKHGNGERVVLVYSRSQDARNWTQDLDEQSEEDDQGPILMFNLVGTSTQVIPPSTTSRLATLSNIHLRSGRHCNAGVIQSHLEVTSDRIKSLWETGVGCNGEGEEESETEGPTSSLRVSLSCWNTTDDVDRFIAFIERFFVLPDLKGFLTNSKTTTKSQDQETNLVALIIYPIKSASGQRIPEHRSWELTSRGLKFDREWCLVSLESEGGKVKVLSQKKHPKMALIHPSLDLEKNILSISLNLDDRTKETWRENEWSWKIEVGMTEGQEIEDQWIQKARVCEDKVSPVLIERRDLREFFSRFLGVACTLARMPSSTSRFSKLPIAQDEQPVPISLSNESPFLLLTQESIRSVKDWIEEDREEKGESPKIQEHATEKEELENVGSRFRGNLIIGSQNEESRHLVQSAPPQKSSHLPLPEDSFTRFAIGPNLFGVLAPCRRCEMVALDPKSGEKKPETVSLELEMQSTR